MSKSEKKDGQISFSPTKPTIQLQRTRTGGKKKPDLFARLREPVIHPVDEILGDENLNLLAENLNSYQPANPPQPNQPIQPITSNPSNPDLMVNEIPISPSRNFTKVHNSLAKHAIPQGLFKGMSKHTYDVLYLRTRGAIIPARQIQITKAELMRLTGLRASLKSLKPAF